MKSRKTDPVELVGYFNGDINNPEISFHIPEKEEDPKNLVFITIKQVPVDRQSFLKHDKLDTEFKNINKELRKLKSATRRLLK